ncbi:hypothetical protein RB195_010743 [Necator americanus]|uniref:DNA polymerase n=1 Tax=Necator americanus TaxID=51031 RepID=A0ABR1CZB8_NECAM
MVDASFKLRNVLCEYSLALPSAVNRSLYPDLRLQVPTFHIFGITPEGKKACVHVHGFLPYMLLRVGGNFTPTLEQRMREKINRMIQREFITNPEQLEKQTTDNYVYRIVPMMAKSIYGYHEEMEQFVKIVFLNPMHRARLFTALAKEVDEFPVMQPFEAHTPFTLQFFIDNSIFGMDEIVFNRVQYRIGHQCDSQEIVFGNFTVADIMNDVSLLSPAPPITSCAVECDALASNIMNKQLHSSNVHSCNPGLEYIWREEATRCSAQGRKLEDTFNNYTPRPYWRNKAETDLLSQLEEVSRIIRANGAATQKDYTQPSEDPVVPEHLLIDNEEELDSTIAWTQDLTAISSENSKAEEEPKGEEEQEGSDEEDIEDNIAAEEEIMKTQIMDNMNKGQDYKEDQADAIEDLFGEDGSPTKPCKRFVDSRWVTLDMDLPLQLRGSAAGKTSASCASDVTIAFQDASFRPMPMNASPDGTAVFSSSTNAEETEEVDLPEIAHLSAASLELLVLTQTTMPDPQLDPLLGFSFCLTSDVCRTLSSSLHVFVTTLPVQKVCNEHLMMVPDERSLFEKLVELVKKSDPDIFFGYDTVRLSWGYILKRAPVIGFLDFHLSLGRYPRVMWLNSLFSVLLGFTNSLSKYSGHKTPLDRHYDLPEEIEPPCGRLLRAIWRILRSELQLRAYDRGTAALRVLKRKLPILDDRALCAEILDTEKPRYSAVAEYVNKLSLLNISLLSEINWFLKTAEMARVYGIQFHEVWSRGSQLRVESMMFRLAHTQGYVLPSVTVSQRTNMEAPEQLQLIMEPFSKVYFDPVIVLDFQSLYPSMVIAYNYCFSTVLGKVCELERMAREKDTSIKLGAIKYTVSKMQLVECILKKKLHCSPLASAFVTQSHRSGILPTLLKEVLGARIMVKASVKHARGKRLRRILEARQLALKLVANVTYGYTSANFSGRMPCVEVADAILGKGRETLERAITRVNEGNYGGAKVIYGDTDSMFVLVPGATKSEAFAIGRRIADDVTKDNPTPVVLKLEKVYMGCVLETKKRYAGWMYENEDDKEGVLDSKGLETIRRDTCPVVAKILEKSLHLIFTRNWRGLSVYLNTKLSRLRDLPYTDFVFSKEFRGEYTDNAPVPQLKVALSLAAGSSAHIALRGERIPYIVTDGPPDASVISCVRSLPEFIADRNLQTHITYYAYAHILPALRRVTDLLQLSIRWNAEATSPCFTPGCLTANSDPWCSFCVELTSAFQFAVMSLSREERLQALARIACGHCQKHPFCDMHSCQNHTCAVKKIWNCSIRSRAPSAVRKHRLFAHCSISED